MKKTTAAFLIAIAAVLVISSPNPFTGMLVIPDPGCYVFEGISLSEIPDENQMQSISIIKPRVFGIVEAFPNAERAEWINNLSYDELGYEFKRFYGNSRFDNLILLKPHLDKIDIIGYCPTILSDYVEEEELSRRIDLLMEAYPGKEILIGPCIDLFDKVRSSASKPDYLGFELFERDFDNYLKGNYDYLISGIQHQRVDLDIYLPFSESSDLERLEGVLNKASYQNLSIGCMIDGSKRTFDFMIENRCK
jgi:hypothetical protein